MSTHPSRSSRQQVPSIASSPAVAGFRPASAALAIAAAFCLQPVLVHAQPVGGVAIHGTAVIPPPSRGNLTVTTSNGTGSNHSAINWQSFSVPKDTVTNFVQPSATSTSINRVVGPRAAPNQPNISEIFGTLSSNGRLVLVNPEGIAIGKGGMVDTAGFTASTLGMSPADAIAGRLLFHGAGTGNVHVDGTIRASGGDVVLIGPKVQTGVDALVQSNGAVILSAGQKVEITGRGLEGIHLEVQAGNEAVNLGKLQGDAVGMFAGTLRHSGSMGVQAVSTEGGKVVLKAIGGDNLVSGTVTAGAAAGKGGSIDVLGRRVGLLAGAALDASGDNGGGSIRVGGDYQGRNVDVPNAARTYVDSAASIRADAKLQGDGGRVIVWSDEATRMRGQISARGGAHGGNGGFAEVSGKQYLEFTGRADLRAPNGHSGTLLLDPNDIEIRNVLPADSTVSENTTNVDTVPPRIDTRFEDGPATSVLSVDRLNMQLEIGNVYVTTSTSTATGPQGGRITLVAGASIAWGAGTWLELFADTDIVLQANTSITGPGGLLGMTAQNGSIDASLSPIKVASVYAHASGSASAAGRVLLTNAGNQIGAVAGSASGPAAQFSASTTGNLVIGEVDGAFGRANGISAGGPVDVTVTGGQLSVVDAINAGSLTLQAVGSASDLLLDASIDASGPVTLKAGRDLRMGTVNPNFVGVSSSGMLDMSAGSDVVVGRTSAAPPPDPSGAPVPAPISNVSLGSTGGLALTAGRNITFVTGAPAGDTAHQLTTSNSSAGITVDAGGTIDFGPATFIEATDGGILVKSGTGTTLTTGGILGSGQFATRGGLQGTVVLEGNRGALSFNSIRTTSSSSGSFSNLRDGGKVMLTARDDITGGTIAANGTDNFSTLGSGGNGGVVAVTSGNGDIRLQRVTANGGLDRSGTAGGGGGRVEVTAGAGSVSLSQIDVSGRGSVAGNGGGGAGGTLTVFAGHAIAMADPQAAIDARGGDAAGTGTAGAGGTVTMTAGNDIVIAPTNGYAVMANGGNSPAGAAGDGGSLTFSSTGGSVRLVGAPAAPAPPPISTDGPPPPPPPPPPAAALAGVSANGGNGGTSGAGGSVIVHASTSIESNLIDASGGNASASGAAGGEGGFVQLTFGTSALLPQVSTRGGDGGGNTAAAVTGAGGAGGQILLARTAGDLVLDSSTRLDASGGRGGSASIAPGAGGAGGNGGQIILSVPGQATLRSPDLVALGGQGGSNSDESPGASGNIGGLIVGSAATLSEGAFNLQASWSHASPLTVASGGSITGAGGMLNFGDLILLGGANVMPQLGVDNQPGARIRSSGAGNTVNLGLNAGSVEVATGSDLTLPFFFSNAGTLVADGKLQVGLPGSSSLVSASTFAGPTLTNQSTGLITGSGTLQVADGLGTVDNFGAIAPGRVGGVGTLQLLANLFMESGSKVVTDLQSPTVFDILKVGGQTVSGGGFEVTYGSGASFPAGTTFRVLQSASLDSAAMPTVNQPQLTVAASGNDAVLVAQSPV
ncbi:MAG: hypothetical protein JWP41_3026, partial [Ramlibacter sp.]|nr:hypothetical protein [Ramlibacter sp.]